MGPALCKNTKKSETVGDDDKTKKIVIGVFGVDNAGKTTAVKAIEGNPTKDTNPTVSIDYLQVPNPIGDDTIVTLIDVGGSQKARSRSWPTLYKKIHGLIFVIEYTEDAFNREIEDVFLKLLDEDDLKNKPILILANKQDANDAIDDKQLLEERLNIKKLKAKYKVELCTAKPKGKNKVDKNIKEGFVWLIQEINGNYVALNSRVDPKASNSDKKLTGPSTNPKNRTQSSSDDDHDIVGPRGRSPLPNGRRFDQSSNRLPTINSSRSKGSHRDGYQTYSENEDGEKKTRSNSKKPFDETGKRGLDRKTYDLNLPSTSGSLSKRFPANKANDKSDDSDDPKPKKVQDTGMKSFRSSFERLPEDPLISTSKRSNKVDNISGYPSIRSRQPIDSTKPEKGSSAYDKFALSGSKLGRSTMSDDEGDNRSTGFKGKPPTSTDFSSKDPYDFKKFDSKYQSQLPIKKTSTSIYGQNNNDDFDLDKINDLKKPYSSKPTKRFGSDDEDLNKNSTGNSRLLTGNDFRSAGTRSQLPSLANSASSKPKLDDDIYSSSNKTFSRSRFGTTDDIRPISSPKTTTRARSPTEDYGAVGRSSSAIKSTTDPYGSSPSKFPQRNRLDNIYPPSSKPSSSSRYDDKIDADRMSSPKSTSRIKTKFDLDDIDETPKSTYDSTYSKYNESKPSPSAAKAPIRSNYRDDDYDSKVPPLKTSTRSNYKDDDDDEYSSSRKPFSTKDSKGQTSSSISKPTTKIKYSDDEDEYKYSPKTTAPRTTYSNKEGFSSSTKPLARSNYSDDDDNQYSSTKNNKTSSIKDTKRGSSPIVKSSTKTNYSDDDDDYKPSTKSQVKSSKHYDDDDDDYKPATTKKPPARSTYDDDDDDVGKNDKYKSSTKSFKDRLPSNSSKKFNDDDDDNEYRRSSPKTAATRSNYSDDDDSYSHKKTSSVNKPSISTSTSKKASSLSRFDDDD